MYVGWRTEYSPLFMFLYVIVTKSTIPLDLITPLLVCQIESYFAYELMTPDCIGVRYAAAAMSHECLNWRRTDVTGRSNFLPAESVSTM